MHEMLHIIEHSVLDTLKLVPFLFLTYLAMEYLEPVMVLLRRLEELGQLDGSMVGILLKCVGIGLITEIAGMVCTDSGNGSMAKALQLLGTAAVLWLAVPLFDGLLTLIQEILEGL